MKRLATRIFAMAVPVFSLAVTFIAPDNAPAPYGEEYGGQLSLQIRNECLLAAKNCAARASTVLQRAHDLRQEINKGLDVYTFEELKTMQKQLNWIETESGNELNNCARC